MISYLVLFCPLNGSHDSLHDSCCPHCNITLRRHILKMTKTRSQTCTFVTLISTWSHSFPSPNNEWKSPTLILKSDLCIIQIVRLHREGPLPSSLFFACLARLFVTLMAAGTLLRLKRSGSTFNFLLFISSDQKSHLKYEHQNPFLSIASFWLSNWH